MRRESPVLVGPPPRHSELTARWAVEATGYRRLTPARCIAQAVLRPLFTGSASNTTSSSRPIPKNANNTTRAVVVPYGSLETLALRTLHHHPDLPEWGAPAAEGQPSPRSVTKVSKCNTRIASANDPAENPAKPAASPENVPFLPQRLALLFQIGRASCRESVKNWVESV